MRHSTKRVVTYFIQGLLSLLPLLVTGYVVFLLFSIVRGLAEHVMVLLPQSISNIGFIRIALQGIFVGLVFLSIVIFGMIVSTMVGTKILKMVDNFFAKVPGLNRIYKATKQVAEVFRSGKKQFFTHPVLVQYPSPGIWAVAFNTGDASEMCSHEGRGKFYTVFIPTTPNPTSGFLAIVNQDQIRKLDITVEDAIKLILTGGMVKTSNQPDGVLVKTP